MWTLATPWTVACQAPVSLGLPEQEYWSELPFPSPGDLPDPGIETASPALAGRFFTTEPPGKPIVRAGKPQILDIVLIPGECSTLAVLTSSQQIPKNSLCMLLLQLRPHPHDLNSTSQMFLHKAPFRSSHRRKSTVPNPFPRKRWWWVSSTHRQQWRELCCGV